MMRLSDRVCVDCENLYAPNSPRQKRCTPCRDVYEFQCPKCGNPKSRARKQCKGCGQRQREATWSSPEYRQKLSLAAKEKGYGKWMLGRDTSHYADRVANRRGKTYEEIYGDDRADDERTKRQEGNRIAWAGRKRYWSEDGLNRIGNRTRGRTYDQIYGSDRANQICRSRSKILRLYYENIGRRNDARPKHNGSYEYVEWRTAVFTRDDFTCQRCGARGGTLHAHHILPWAKYPDQRYDVDNGKTLCADPCHKQEHRDMRQTVIRPDDRR